MYVTYSYYKEQYAGSLPEEEFIKADDGQKRIFAI